MKGNGHPTNNQNMLHFYIRNIRINYTVMLFITRQIQVLLKMVFSRYLKKFFYILTQHYMYLNTRLSIISLLYSVM